MKRILITLLISALVTGCVTFRNRVLSFPPLRSTFYDAPDGRRWFVTESPSQKDFPYVLMLTPDPTPPKEWKEMLTFAESVNNISLASMRAKFSEMVADVDPGLTYQVEGDEDAFIVTYCSPAWNESGVQKIVKFPGGCRTVFYQERLGAAGASMLKVWSKVITTTPNQALLPTSTAVTPAASHPPRQP